MSSREPMWFCHECHAEMRPLMVPDPHCASCNGTFVEKIENTSDDPRAFQGPGHFEEDVVDPEDFLFSFLRTAQPRSPGSPLAGQRAGPRPPGGGNGFTIHINRSSGNDGPRTTISGGPMRSPGLGSPGGIPRMSDFARQYGAQPAGAGADPGTIDGDLMFRYLLTMLGHARGGGGGGLDFLNGMQPGGEGGRWGDYVFSQEALDQIITQIMESSQHHPVAATEEIIDKLPREVLEEGSPLLEKDCAICKDQFSTKTEDPAEQIIITLPCKHPFHEPCIIPWLKSSGTCPVCRFQLVHQPEHHAPGSSPSGSSGGSGGRRSQSPSGGGGGSAGGGLFGNLFNILGGAVAGPSNPNTGPGGGTNPRRNSAPHNRSASNPNSRRGSTDNNNRQSARRGSTEHQDLPGAWNDVD